MSWLEDFLPGPVVARTSSYTVPPCNGQVIMVGTLGAGITITLPAEPVLGQLVAVKRTGAFDNTITIDGNGKTIDGTATLSALLSHNRAAVWLCYNGSAWSVLSSYYVLLA